MQYRRKDNGKQNNDRKKKPDNPLKKITSPKPTTKKQTNFCKQIPVKKKTNLIEINYSDIINILRKLRRKKQ